MFKGLKKCAVFNLAFLLFFQQSGYVQVIPPYPGAGVNVLPDKFRPLHLRYLSYNQQQNTFRLLLDKGDVKDPGSALIESTSKTLLQYFLIGVTLPDETFWVNLRPDSENNIIDDKLSQTDIGRIMLETDLQLKKDTARFTSPETSEGKEYWDKLYAKAEELYGDEEISIPTYTRPWIVPGEIIIRENQEGAYVYKATLKVMLEQDYLKNSDGYNFDDPRLKALNEYSSELIRRSIIPKITKEVNTSKRYASLRQVYYSLILAKWFKERYAGKTNPYTSLINAQNLQNLTSKDPWSKATYFKAYQKSFKDGEYNVSETRSTPYGQTIRSYFSGGMILVPTQALNLGTTTSDLKTNAVLYSNPASGQLPVDPAMQLDITLKPTGTTGEFKKRAGANTLSSQADGGSSLPISRDYTYPAGAVNINIANPNTNYLRTSTGAISVGMAMGYRELFPDALDYPRIIITPRESWVGKEGENLMQLYFPIFTNFVFHKRKTTIVCRPDQKQRIIRYLELGNPYYLPNMADYSEELISRFRREAVYLADRAVINEKPQMAAPPSSDMVEFVEFSDMGKATIDGVTITDKADGTFSVYDDMQKKEAVLNGSDLQELTLKTEGVTPLSEIPEFGVTFLGTSSGMDPNGLPSNQIVWAGENHILVDVNAPTLSALSALGLTPSNITHIAITHMHEDHIAGVLAYMEWCKRNGHPIRLLAEPGIYELFKEQAKQILNKEIDQVYTIELSPLVFYKNMTLGTGQESVLIESAPAFHGTPTMMLRITYKGRTISLSSDTTFDPERFKQILENKIPGNIRTDLEQSAGATADMRVFDEARVDELTNFLLKQNQDRRSPDMIIYEGGNGAAYDQNTSNHTTPFALQRLLEDLQRNIFVNHTAKFPAGGTFIFQHAVPFSTVKLDGGESNGVASSEKQARTNPLSSSPVSPDKDSSFGGIDFRALPIVTQAMSSFNVGVTMSSEGLKRLRTINLDSELQDLQGMVESGTCPSAERVKEYVQAVSLHGVLAERKGHIILCIVKILRQEEDLSVATEPILNDILVVLESNLSAQELKHIFIGSPDS